jgi:hypothetical protein
MTAVVYTYRQAFKNATYEVRSKDIFNILHWEPIETTLKKREMIMTFKALQGQLPEFMTNIFKICLNDMYPLRSNNCKLYLENPKTASRRNRFHIEVLHHGTIFQMMLSTTIKSSP